MPTTLAVDKRSNTDCERRGAVLRCKLIICKFVRPFEPPETEAKPPFTSLLYQFTVRGIKFEIVFRYVTEPFYK